MIPRANWRWFAAALCLASIGRTDAQDATPRSSKPVKKSTLADMFGKPRAVRFDAEHDDAAFVRPASVNPSPRANKSGRPAQSDIPFDESTGPGVSSLSVGSEEVGSTIPFVAEPTQVEAAEPPSAVVGAMPPPTEFGPALAQPSDVVEGVPMTRIPSVGELLPGPYAEAGVVYLRRETYQEDTFTLFRQGPLNFTQIGTQSFDYNHELGARITVGQPIDCGWYLEGTFIGLHEWSRGGFLSGGFVSQSPTTFADANAFADALSFPAGQFNAQALSLNSRLYSGEGNLKWAMSVLPHAYLLFGVRSANIIEKLTVLESGQVGTAPNVASTALGSMEVRTDNPMVGPQIGYESRAYGAGGRWSLDSHAKLGVLWNLATARISRTLTATPVGPIASTLRDNETSLAGLVDAAFGVSYRFTPRMAVRGGYQVIAIAGVATAAAQRPPSIFAARDHDTYTSERAIYHGPYASLEWTFGGCR